ncbi:O-antigen ligase family protein [Desulfobacterales bacterium HSG2]|nr:O-antigen ligase family protein [Desulfobacterales bacterium HSG2]
MLIITPLVKGAVQEWAVSLIHLVTIVGMTAFLADRSLNWNWKWIRTPVDQPILLLVVLSVLSSLFSVHPQTSLWATVLLLNYVLLFYLTIHTVKTRARLRRLIHIIITMGVFLSVVGLLKRFDANPFPWWEYHNSGYPPEFLSSTYINHNHFAGYAEMSISVMLGFFLTGFSGGKRVLMIYMTGIMVGALVLSLSRGGWIAFGLMLSFMAFALLTNRHFERKRFLISLVGGLVFVIFIIMGSTPVVERILTLPQKEDDPSFNSRLEVWAGIRKMIHDYPLLGTGPGTFGTAFTRYQPPGLRSHFTMAHNDYLHFTAELGLMLIPILIWMIIALFREGFRKLENLSRLVRGTTLGAMSGVFAILVHSAADFNLHIPANALLFTVLAAVVAAPLPKSRKRYGRKERSDDIRKTEYVLQDRTEELREQLKKVPILTGKRRD